MCGCADARARACVCVRVRVHGGGGWNHRLALESNYCSDYKYGLVLEFRLKLGSLSK